MNAERLKDHLKYFATEAGEMERGLEDMFARLLDEINEELVEAGYSSEAEGSKKEMYEGVQQMRKECIERLVKLKCDINALKDLFSTILEELEKRRG